MLRNLKVRFVMLSCDMCVPHASHQENLSKTNNMLKPARGLLVLAQQVVEHPQKLQHSLLSSGVSKAGVVDDKVGVDLAVVPADVESSGQQCVMSYHM